MEERSIDTLSLDGGWLCLDFINTVHDRTVEKPFEYLASYRDLIAWSVKLKLLAPSEGKKLASVAENNEEKAQKVLHQLIEARSILYEFFLDIAQNRVPGGDIQNQFNGLLRDGLQHLNLQVGKKLVVKHRWQNRSDMNFPFYRIIKSAYDLMTSDKLDRVKECGACGWLFLDQSKNKSRKWCSMENCGSLVKAKRYYHKNKDG